MRIHFTPGDIAQIADHAAAWEKAKAGIPYPDNYVDAGDPEAPKKAGLLGEFSLSKATGWPVNTVWGDSDPGWDFCPGGVKIQSKYSPKPFAFLAETVPYDRDGKPIYAKVTWDLAILTVGTDDPLVTKIVGGIWLEDFIKASFTFDMGRERPGKTGKRQCMEHQDLIAWEDLAPALLDLKVSS